MKGFTKKIAVGPRQAEFTFLAVDTPTGLAYTVFTGGENSAFKIYQNESSAWHVHRSDLPEWLHGHEGFFLQIIEEAAGV